MATIGQRPTVTTGATHIDRNAPLHQRLGSHIPGVRPPSMPQSTNGRTRGVSAMTTMTNPAATAVSLDEMRCLTRFRMLGAREGPGDACALMNSGC